jgi:hypothetical protein
MSQTKSSPRGITIFLKGDADISRWKMERSNNIMHYSKMTIQYPCIYYSFMIFSPSFEDYDRALYTKDIEGTAPGTLISKVVKNKELA